MNCAASAVAVILSDNMLMCWDTKVVSLLHVYVPLTGNKADSFLQRFHFFCDFSNRSLCISHFNHFYYIFLVVLYKAKKSSLGEDDLYPYVCVYQGLNRLKYFLKIRYGRFSLSVIKKFRFSALLIT
jgi:hypothetical protein